MGNTNTKINRNEQERRICQLFQIPKAAENLIDFFFTKEEQDFILTHGEGPFPDTAVSPEFIAQEYRRGLISKVDESGRTYRLNHFYSMLDVFVVSNKEKYDTLSKEQKKALDDWYFDAYYDGLSKEQTHPTSDRIVPLDEMLALIDKDERPVYLNFCDCRSLKGECGLPTRTCITYRCGINSFADRGLSERIDKERAKQVVRDADRAGLMHTINEGGICNCCGDCCYLFRTQQRLGSTGTWPRTENVVRMEQTKCISCGKCVKRCHFGIFIRGDDHKIRCDTSACVGCGLCVYTCPAGALELAGRHSKQNEERA